MSRLIRRKLAGVLGRDKADCDSLHTIGTAKSISFVSDLIHLISIVSFLHSPVLHLAEIALDLRCAVLSLAALQSLFSAKELLAVGGRLECLSGFLVI
jgi:hypothetical protein